MRNRVAASLAALLARAGAMSRWKYATEATASLAVASTQASERLSSFSWCWSQRAACLVASIAAVSRATEATIITTSIVLSWRTLRRLHHNQQLRSCTLSLRPRLLSPFHHHYPIPANNKMLACSIRRVICRCHNSTLSNQQRLQHTKHYQLYQLERYWNKCRLHSNEHKYVEK